MSIADLRLLRIFATHRTRADRPTRQGRWRQARIDVRGEFVPDIVVARVGEPLRLVFRRQSGPSSAERIVFPTLGRSATLPPAEDVPVEIVPSEPGEYEFSCQEGILRGRLLVVRR